jgi:glutamate--cysteine ligase
MLPLYASFDVRDSGQLLAPVDANIYPAGFNNICPVDQENAPLLIKSFLQKHYPNVGTKIGLLAEEHTSNAYYWQNIVTIKTLLERAGYTVVVAWPKSLPEPVTVRSIQGQELLVFGSHNENGKTTVGDSNVDMLVCNNDFSNSYADWTKSLATPMNPPYQLGWYQRKKHHFFQHYNQLVEDFAKLIQIPAGYMRVETELFANFDVYDPDRLEALAAHVDTFLNKMKLKYEKLEISDKPFCFVKNNAGTYGLAVTQVFSGDDVREWNNKARKKMQAAKGGRQVDELIIQEGIPTMFQEGGGAAEPCIYTIGEELVGGFLRTHSEKGPEESLNSPGAVYKKLCMSDLLTDRQGCPMENVYGWVAKLGVISIAREAREAQIPFPAYQN